MQNSNMRTIRGLSIAALVLAILAILLAIMVGSLLALTVSVLPEAIDAAWEYSFTDEELYEFYELGMNEENTTVILQSMFGIAGVFVFFFVACCVVCLVASILGLKNYNKPEKLGLVFGWSIAAAICAFCTARVISAVLLVVMAVMINKVRTEAKLHAAYAQQPMPYTPYGQPQAPYATPSAPYAPYGQPQDPNAPSAQQTPYAAYTATPESAMPPCGQTAGFSSQPPEQSGNNPSSTALDQEDPSQKSNS